MKNDIPHQQFLTELKALLKKYNVQLDAEQIEYPRNAIMLMADYMENDKYKSTGNLIGYIDQDTEVSITPETLTEIIYDK